MEITIKGSSSEIAALKRTPRVPCAPLSYTGETPDVNLDLERVIAQLDSIRDSSRSFIGSDDEGIWEADVKACDAAIAVLTALRDAGVNSLEQVRELATGRKTGQTASSIKLAVVCVDTDMVQCIGVFDNYTIAYGQALAHLGEAAQCEDDARRIVPPVDVCDFDASLGERIEMLDSQGKVDETVYILRVQS